ncbi:MAG: cell wall hydrolase [Candidatus Roizmanbacteria bacterium]|nr:cell wall hydrolase [Candidatus Roizmanbacteria bacterium]
MKSIFEDGHSRTIKMKEKIKFSSFSSYHLIIITARTKSEKQISPTVTDDEDLIVKIDGKTFPKLHSDRLKDSPAAFSGGRLHNLSKIVYFLTFLKGKDHEIVLEADQPLGTATFENLQVYALSPTDKLTLEPKIQAEDGDRRPWLTFVLDNLLLKSIAPTITYSRRKRDSDDVKIIIDGNTQGNPLRTIKHFLWRYAGSLLPWIAPTKTETEIFTINLPQDLHYIEFDADRMPTFNKLVLDFGSSLPLLAGIPSVDNPKWTGDFYDDTDVIILARLIFGEARNQSDEAMTGVAWVIKNRLRANRQYFGKSYHEIILKNDGKYYQFSSFNPNEKDNFPLLIDPLKTKNTIIQKAWFNSYEVALRVISGIGNDPTGGATFFHSSDLSREKFVTESVPGAIYIKPIGDFLFYRDPNEI